MTAPRVRGCGPDALLVEVADAAEALELATWVRAGAVAVLDVVPAARTVLLDGVGDPAALRRLLAAWRPTGTVPRGELVEVPTRYDGPDLDDVAAAWGVDRAEAVRRHGQVEFVSAFCGFAPGFSYLAGLPAELEVARLATPRARVPAGSVALAGRWGGVYPTASPGGWRLLGRTDVVLWDPGRAQPALLPPGTRVRFVPA